MTDQQQPSLWRAMKQAFLTRQAFMARRAPDLADRFGWAAAIRDLADRVEGMEPPEYKQYYEDGAQVAISAVAAMLRSEADRAEEGQ